MIDDRREDRQVNGPTATGSLLSAEDVARICGLSRRAVYDAIKRGELPAFRLCSRLRIKPADLNAWLLGNAVEPPAPAHLPRLEVQRDPLPRGSFRAKLREGRGVER